MKFKIRCMLVLPLLLALAPAVLAQEPDNRNERMWRRQEGEWRMRRGFRIDPPSDAEWGELTAFMKDNSPRRWEIFENLPENTPMRDRARNLLVSRYRMLTRTKGEDDQLFTILLDRVKLEDQIFGIVSDLKKAQAENLPLADHEALRSNFRTRTSELIELGIKERKLRIDRLQKSLELERDKLGNDEKNRNALIEDRMRRFETGEFAPGPANSKSQATTEPADPNLPPQTTPEPAPVGPIQ